MNVAPQALFLRQQIRGGAIEAVCCRVLGMAGVGESERVRMAYRVAALSRAAAPEEVALTYMTGRAERLGNGEGERQARENFCHILISTNEFLYLD